MSPAPHPPAEPDDSGIRIAELARRTGVSVRNIREYQDRGLLPAPRRVGRVALYDESHVVRIELIDRLLRRGYTLAVIRDLLEAWASGRELSDVLGLETIVSEPWTDEEAGPVTMMALRRMFGWQLTPAVIRRAVRMGILIPRGPRAFLAPSPALITSGGVLVAAGIPLRTVLDVIERVREEIEMPADRLVAMVFSHIISPDEPGGLPSGADLPRLTQTVAELRPHAQRTVDTLFAQAMTRAVDRAFAQLTVRAIDGPATETSASPPGRRRTSPDATA